MNEKYSYTMTSNYSNGNLQAILTRSDGFVIRSSWWGIDDGSAEAEAYDLMREHEEKSRK